MVKLSFLVKTDLVIGGRVCSPASFVSSGRPPALCESGQPPDVSESAAGSNITGFYLTAFASGNSEVFCLRKLDGSPQGTLFELDWPKDAPDTIKFSLDFGQATPRTVRSDHLASDFLTMTQFANMLSGKDSSFLIMQDNFTRNAAHLRFSNRGTDLKGLARLSLTPSSLLKRDVVNGAIGRMGEFLQQWVSSECSVSPLNAGTQFMQGFTLGHMSKHELHYAVLGHVFDQLDSPVNSAQVMYNLVNAMHSTNLSFGALRAMPDWELVPRLGLAAAARHTLCALTNVYCPDVTIAPTGAACRLRDTEDIAKSFGRISHMIQNENSLRPYNKPLDCSCTLQEALQAIAEDQRALARSPDSLGACRKTPTLDADDCENKAQSIMMVCSAMRGLAQRFATPGALAEHFRQVAAAYPRVFAQVAQEDFADLADVAHRLGGMLVDGRWRMGFAVVSAKGPSYTENGEGLCGHGAGIARVLSGVDRGGRDVYQYYPVEGTTYLAVDYPVPEGYASELKVKMQDDTLKAFPLETLLGVISQNVHATLGLSANANALAHLRRDYGKNPLDSPFYDSTFYMNALPEGLGCIPTNSRPPASFRAGAKPLFGAPFMGLSSEGVKSFVLTQDMLAAPGQDPAEVARLLSEQVKESWEPGVSEAMLSNYFTYVQPVKSPKAPTLTARNYATHVRAENSWAYDDPQLTAKAVMVYQRLADKFNEIQARDPCSDKATASAYGQYLSACLGISMPVPRVNEADKFTLTTYRNLVKAAEALGLQKGLSACALKTAMIGARAQIQSDHHIYMCDRGEGIVHSYRNRLHPKG